MAPAQKFFAVSAGVTGALLRLEPLARAGEFRRRRREPDPPEVP